MSSCLFKDRRLPRHRGLARLSVFGSVRDRAVEPLRLPREEGVALVRDEAAVVGPVVGHVGLAVGVQEEVAEHDVVTVSRGLLKDYEAPSVRNLGDTFLRCLLTFGNV